MSHFLKKTTFHEKNLSNYIVILLVYFLYSLYYYFTRENFTDTFFEITIVTLIIISIFGFIDYRKKGDEKSEA